MSLTHEQRQDLRDDMRAARDLSRRIRTVSKTDFLPASQNRLAAEIDELRTEGHQDTRPPLSTAHEAP